MTTRRVRTAVLPILILAAPSASYTHARKHPSRSMARVSPTATA
jgi:hypothetical protein